MNAEVMYLMNCPESVFLPVLNMLVLIETDGTLDCHASFIGSKSSKMIHSNALVSTFEEWYVA